MLAGPISIEVLTTPHGGHVSPIGLLAQWSVQHALPGLYVPLMGISALLVALAQVGVGLWARRTYGERGLALVVAAFLGLTTMLLELATWWSVALYASPMVAASAWLLYFAAQFMETGRGRGLLLACLFLSLLSSVKAVLLPVLLLTFAAVTPLAGARPLGYRGALRRWCSLWITLAFALCAYAVLYLMVSDSATSGVKGPGVYLQWLAKLWTGALLPALWGGPWAWTGRFGLEALPPSVVILLLCLTAVAAAGIYRQGPSSRRVLVGWAVYVVGSSLLVAQGRAGLSLAGPSLRYVFDIALPTAVVLVTVVNAQRLKSGLGNRWLALLGAGWMVSTAVTYVHAWPDELSITKWSASVRAHYPQVQDGLLEQPMPSEFVLFPQRLATYLSGDKGAPEERAYVLDELLGFDADGSLITSSVFGTPAVPPSFHCQYLAQSDRDAMIPLSASVPDARHTAAIDYTSSNASTIAVDLGSASTTANAPAGTHRLYVSVEGSGSWLRLRVANPISTVCIHAATVGWIVPGVPVVE
jgi:hypothetical protein